MPLRSSVNISSIKRFNPATSRTSADNANSISVCSFNRSTLGLFSKRLIPFLIRSLRSRFISTESMTFIAVNDLAPVLSINAINPSPISLPSILLFILFFTNQRYVKISGFRLRQIIQSPSFIV